MKNKFRNTPKLQYVKMIDCKQYTFYPYLSYYIICGNDWLWSIYTSYIRLLFIFIFFFFSSLRSLHQKVKIACETSKHWWVRRPPTWSTRKEARGDGKICYLSTKRPYTLLNIALLRHVSFPLFYFVVACFL